MIFLTGKGGETIKSLQERAGCKMVLFQDGEYQQSNEKPLRISGEHTKVMVFHFPYYLKLSNYFMFLL